MEGTIEGIAGSALGKAIRPTGLLEGEVNLLNELADRLSNHVVNMAQQANVLGLPEYPESESVKSPSPDQPVGMVHKLADARSRLFRTMIDAESQFGRFNNL